MEASALKLYLQRICDEMGWAYAIFWKLNHELPQSLTWEDGYFTRQLTRDEAPSSEIKELVSLGKDFVSKENYADNSLALTVAQMSSIKHEVGEGLLGRVACTNFPRMISLDNDAASHSMEVPFAPDVPLLFSSTKTILLVPVRPHGVLQLGSFEEVAEDVAVANHVRESFNVAICSNYSQHEDLDTQIPFPVKVLCDPSPVGIRDVNRLPKESTCYPGNGIKFKTDSTPMSHLDILEEASPFEIFPFPNDLVDAEIGDSMENMNFWISCLEEQSPALSGACGSGNSKDSSSLVQRPCDADIMKKPFGSDVCSTITNGAMGRTFSFTPGCELHKALGAAFMKREWKTASESLVSSGNLFSISDLIDETNLLNDSYTSIPCLLQEKAESFLEIMVTNLSETPDASSVSDLYDANPFIPSLTQVSAPPLAYGSSNASSFVQVDSLSKHNTSEVSKNGNTASGTSGPAFKNLASIFIKKPLKDEPLPHVPMRRLDKPSTGCRKRGRARENQRPRPRDRQLIQERLKELRELVPSSAKCSIDSLLDRTISHMTFLGRVIKQAEKLGKIAMLKETKLNCDSPDDNFLQAMAFGGKTETYPIAVEDLTLPGHMLIKMRCTEHGLFLDMTEVISRLPLTILKGLLEIHSNETWACFVVEVTNGFHKMDIFWSLMQLLRRAKGPPSSTV